jgi:1,4-alpha-glucan branching enzyme
MVTKLPSRCGKVKVTFVMPSALWADSIHVVGDFNGWDERATPLRQSESGWMVSLELEGGQAYQYRYLLNGTEWHNDWQADSYAQNRFGGDNSVVITPDFDLDEPDGDGRVIPFTAPRLRLLG